MMDNAQYASYARPYAKALFASAKTSDSRASYAGFLSALAHIISDVRVQARLNDPRLDRSTWVEWLGSFFARKLTKEEQAFLMLLAERKRLNVLPAIAALFEGLRQEAEKRMTVEIYTAFPLSQRMREQLLAKLEHRFAKRVEPQYREDQSLIGGVMIRIGDWVWDGSVKEQLMQLSNELMK